ncbi:MAG: ABC transporter permease [Anaerolineae bacterium]
METRKRKKAIPLREPNPLLVKELRGRVRSTRAFVVLTVYLLLLSCLASLIYYVSGEGLRASVGRSSTADIGRSVFSGIVLLQVLLVAFITPGLTAGAISGEREQKTYELLRATLLPARKLVSGKLASALVYVILLILAAVPLESLAFMLGGVVVEELALALVILLVTALAFGTVGLFFSSMVRRTRSSIVLTNAFALLVTFGLPVLALIIAEGLLPIWAYGSASLISSAMEERIISTVYVLASFSPLAAPILTSLALAEGSSIWITEITPYTSVPSAWIIYAMAYLLLSLVLLLLTVRRLREQEVT